MYSQALSPRLVIVWDLRQARCSRSEQVLANANRFVLSVQLGSEL